MKMLAASILIVDDHPLIRDALTGALQRESPFLAIQATASLEGALERLATSDEPDLVLLDLTLPGHQGLSALWTLREHHPAVAVAIFSAQCDSGTINSALASGARGFLPKHSSPEVIKHALDLMLAGSVYIPADALSTDAAGSHLSAAKNGRQNPMALPTRQREIVELVAKGLSNKEICRELNISPNTVKTHLATIFQVLEVRSRYEIFALFRDISERSNSGFAIKRPKQPASPVRGVSQ